MSIYTQKRGRRGFFDFKEDKNRILQTQNAKEDETRNFSIFIEDKKSVIFQNFRGEGYFFELFVGQPKNILVYQRGNVPFQSCMFKSRGLNENLFQKVFPLTEVWPSLCNVLFL